MTSVESSKIFELNPVDYDTSQDGILVTAWIEDTSTRVAIPACCRTRVAIKRIVSGRASGTRYRLSLRCLWNPFEKQYFSSLTEVSCDRRRIRYFPCSPQYRTTLARLRDVGDVQELKSPSLGKQEEQPSTRCAPKELLPVSAFAIVLILFAALGVFSLVHSFWGTGSIAASSESQVEESAFPDDDTLDRLHGKLVTASEVQTTESSQKKSDNISAADASGDASGDDCFETVDLQKGEELFTVSDEQVALTFDDGPTPFTRKIIDVLAEHDVVATFFFVGKHAANFPDAVKYANEKRMAVGNHTWSHDNLVRARTRDIEMEIDKTNEILTSLTGESVRQFRPPYGLIDEDVEKVVEQEQMKTVMWCYDARDWNASDSREVVDYVTDETDPSGGVYLFHENPMVLKALPDIIEFFQKQGLTFVIFE